MNLVLFLVSYVPGSIVRIQLKNFVTYDFVEFRPGSSLNMIFGPNGTGKLTIACAICIGLGGSPALLGRSTELNAFVKQGYDLGYVELELKGKIGTRNFVIRCSINSKNWSSQYIPLMVPMPPVVKSVNDLLNLTFKLAIFAPSSLRIVFLNLHK